MTGRLSSLRPRGVLCLSEQGKGAHTYEEAVAIQVEIQDDFDLDKIASCGQCFRVRKDGSGRFRFIMGDLLPIRHIAGYYINLR